MKTIELIHVNCPVCSEKSYKIIFPDTLGNNLPVFGYKWTPEIRKHHRIVKCISCGHQYTSPRLKDMVKYYVDVVDNDYLKNSWLRKRTSKLVIDTIKRYKRSGALIDIGCSTGDFLSVARKSYIAEGLELSNWASEIAIRKGLTIRKGLSKIAESGKKYDVATLWGVIEHMEDPLTEMLHVNRLMNNQGIVFLWTGDADSLFAKMLKEYWWYILGQHVQFFNKRSLNHLMEKAGFTLVYMGIYPYVISFEYLAISLLRYPIVGQLAKKLFQLFNIENLTFTLKKTDEILVGYKKVRHI